MSGIGIIVNPKGKQYQRDPDKLSRLSFIVGDRGSYQTTEDLSDLRRVAEQFKTRDIDILAIGGGDGTSHVTLTNFIEVYGEKSLPKVTFLRGGTMNTLANACSIKGRPEKILSNLIYKYHEGEDFQTTEVDLMKINQHYGFLFGFGVIYRFMERYYEGSTPSPAKAAYVFSRAVSSAFFNTAYTNQIFSRFEAEVWVDGKKWPFANYSALFAGSIPVLGLGFKVFRYSKTEYRFHAAGFSLPPRNIIRHLPDMYFGNDNPCEEILEAPAQEFKIKLKEPMPYIIDGDRLSPEKEFLITTGPRLKILVK